LGTPRIPRLVAASLAIEAERLRLSQEERPDWFARRGAEIESAVDGDGPLHVYRRGEEIVAAHVIPLLQYEDLRHSLTAQILDVFEDVAAGAQRSGDAGRMQRRRATLLRKLRERAASLERQLAALHDREMELAGRDSLRVAGETIYAYLAQIPIGSSRFDAPHQPELTVDLDPTLSPKENAKRYFERYKKENASVGHVAKRREALERKRAELDALLWEIERADDEALLEIASDLEGKPPPKSRRKLVPFELQSGARVYVGRSPRDNADITFRIARPDDLWFHARNVPGAHVVLHPASGVAPPRDEIASAAQLAALHSRARNSSAVDVDYTRRKYVRKQRDAAPGMVWYTNAQTIRVPPAQPPALRRSK
jgi:predicted ribosome quality control (RQC) complex YloA/Tae2 family protein